MDLGIQGRVALVSGASQGLGRAVAFAFAEEGVHLALCARNADALTRLAEEIRERFKVDVYTESVDMRESDATQRFVESAALHFNRIDICVANAGGPPAKDFLETTDEDWDRAFQLNLRSAISLARSVLPGMQERHWGRIVTISSITVRQPLPHLLLSNAVRTGILGLIRSLSNDFAQYGITINNVGPGYTATDRLLQLSKSQAASTGKSQEEIHQEWERDIPAGRLGKPEEIADAVVWLASERAAYVTGQTILVDGGMYKGL